MELTAVTSPETKHRPASPPFAWLVAVACAFGLAWLGGLGSASAQGLASDQGSLPDEVEVPDALAPWTSWVLEEHPKLRCASTSDGETCVWPERLSMRVEDGGASFELRVWLAARDTVPLPGSEDLWPHELSTTGSELTLVESNDRPAVELAAGTHRVRGRLEWEDRPSSIGVPRSAARIDLEVDGESVESPKTGSAEDGVASLYLDQTEQERGADTGGESEEKEDGAEEDYLKILLHRKLTDGVPLEVETHVELVVGGDARTIELGPVLLEDSVPVSYRLEGRAEPAPTPSQQSGQSELVVRGLDGREVTVHASPGRHEMTVVSVFPEYPSSIAVPERAEDFYPEREFWAWEPSPDIHSVEVGGLRPIGPSQTTLPKQWHDHSTFAAVPRETFTLATSSRGAEPSPNALELDRTVFLRDGGDGYAIRDRIDGTMKQGWRFDYRGPAQLGRVSTLEDDSLRLVTKSPDGDGRGVEQRRTEVGLEAASTLEGAISQGPFVGWNFEPESIETTLAMPPGWQFAYATGVDTIASRTWIEAWSLWDLFFVLLVAVVVGRATRWYWGVLAVPVLAGCHVSEMAPWWLWFLVAVGVSVGSMERPDWLESSFRVACVIVAGLFCFHLAWFAVGQSVKATYPRLSQELDRVFEHDRARPMQAVLGMFVGGVVQRQEQKAQQLLGNQVEILKAKHELQPGTRISEEDVVSDEVPEKFVPDNVVRGNQFEQLEGTRVTQRVAEGKMLVAYELDADAEKEKKREDDGGPEIIDVSEGSSARGAGAGAETKSKGGGRSSEDRQKEDRQKEDRQKMARRRRALKRQRARRMGEEVEKLDVERSRADAIEQTGPGLPERTDNRVTFSWSKAVPSDHRVRFWLLPPWLKSLLYLLHLAATFVLARVLLGEGVRTLRRGESGALETWTGYLRGLTERTGGMLAAAGMSALAAFGAPEPASAAQGEASSFPPGELLDELESRLTDAYACAGPCLQVPRAEVRVDGSQLSATLEVHAQKPAGVPLPGTPETLRLDGVRVDGSPTVQMRGGSEGEVVVRVEGGVHEVAYSGVLPEGVARHRLAFGLSGRGPRHLSFESENWRIEQGSLRSNGQPRDVVTLVNEAMEGEQTERDASSSDGPSFGEPEPWYRIRRQFTLGLPWKVQTNVERKYPRTTTVLNYPLLDGETPANPLWEVEDGKIAVEFSEGQSVQSFASKLSTRKTFELKSPADRPWTERWAIECTRVWHCSFSDLSAVSLIEEGRYRPTWYPRRGESLEVTAVRPEPVEGRSKTVHNVAYRATLGERLLEATVDLKIRSSRGGQQRLTLPGEANLQELKVNGESRSNRNLEEGELTVDLPTGQARVKVSWEQPWQPLAVDRLPAVDLGSPAANVVTRMEYAEGFDPLVLAVGGPDRGTVSLLWMQLLWIPLLAFLFGRFRALPIRTWEWALLGFGFLQVAATTYSLAGVFLCFVLFALREAIGEPESTWKFNLFQVALAVAALSAAWALYRAGWTNFFAHDFDAHLASVEPRPGELAWYVDVTEGELSRPWVFALPEWTWRVAGLLWAGWVVARLPSWGGWLWERFRLDGYFRRPDFWQQEEEESAESAADGSVEPHQEGSGSVETGTTETDASDESASGSGDDAAFERDGGPRKGESADEPETSPEGGAEEGREQSSEASGEADEEDEADGADTSGRDGAEASSDDTDDEEGDDEEDDEHSDERRDGDG